MKLSDITFQNLTIYDKATRNVIAETAQNLSVAKEAEICCLGGHICLDYPECGKMLGLNYIFQHIKDMRGKNGKNLNII